MLTSEFSICLGFCLPVSDCSQRKKRMVQGENSPYPSFRMPSPWARCCPPLTRHHGKHRIKADCAGGEGDNLALLGAEPLLPRGCGSSSGVKEGEGRVILGVPGQDQHPPSRSGTARWHPLRDLAFPCLIAFDLAVARETPSCSFGSICILISNYQQCCSGPAVACRVLTASQGCP